MDMRCRSGVRAERTATPGGVYFERLAGGSASRVVPWSCAVDAFAGRLVTSPVGTDPTANSEVRRTRGPAMTTRRQPWAADLALQPNTAAFTSPRRTSNGTAPTAMPRRTSAGPVAPVALSVSAPMRLSRFGRTPS